MNTPTPLQQAFLQSKRVTTDSRNLLPGDFFVALRGERFDGNDFALQALELGAVWVLADRPSLVGAHPQIIGVEDSLTALQELARWWRSQMAFPIVGLTGSNGKTTTKELFHAVLQSKWKVAATRGNLNNHIGVPLTLLEWKQDLEVGIVEMGANHQGEIEALSAISMPDIGYITNYGKAHLEGFGGVEGVVKGKSELWENLRLRNKKALVCTDDPRMEERTKGLDRLTFGFQGTPNHLFESATQNGFAAVVHQGQRYTSQLSGQYNEQNLAAAVVLGLHFGLSPQAIAQAVASYEPTNNRSQWLKTVRNQVIVDCYNANPSSVEAALRSLATHPNPVFILGDMFELGEEEAHEHAAMITLAQSLGLTKGFLAGPAFSNAAGPYPSAPSAAALAPLIQSAQLNHCTILLKGSRGMKMETLLGLL
jgi:UDP-N-acetylmuramoyl-tripeptide--D-alanyl-D-alanine ligase